MKRIINMGPDVYPLIGESRVQQLEAFLKRVPARTKHGPAGTGEKGPCDPDCLKCEAERLLAPKPPDEDDMKMFAVWCTVSDFFHEVDGETTWTTADELEQCFNREIEKLRTSFPSTATASDIAVAHREVKYRSELRDRCVSLARGSGY